MTCCKCCCEAKNPPGVCCGGPTEEDKICCQSPRVCCGEVCCPEDECCNNGECGPCECDPPCPECHECIETSPGVFECVNTCAGLWCCDGECVPSCIDNSAVECACYPIGEPEAAVCCPPLEEIWGCCGCFAGECADRVKQAYIPNPPVPNPPQFGICEEEPTNCACTAIQLGWVILCLGRDDPAFHPDKSPVGPQCPCGTFPQLKSWTPGKTYDQMTVNDYVFECVSNDQYPTLVDPNFYPACVDPP